MGKRRRALADPNLREIVASLISDRADPAELIELFYWSQEPNVLPALRALMSMNEDTRAAVCAYLDMAREPSGIGAYLTENGGLLLATPDNVDLDSTHHSGKRTLVN